MPKTEIDYSNTIIYKITCKDSNVNDIYVGHTTNFVQRKHAHKQSCINVKSPNHKCKVYEVIRNNGGWHNWKMEIINFFNCQDHYEARQKEQEFFVSLNATLNSIEPMPKPKFKPIMVTENTVKNTFYCEKCNIHCDNVKLLEIHNNTKKHKKKVMTAIDNGGQMFSNKIMPKICSNFYCENCDYGTSKKSSYDNHLMSAKHIKSMVSNEIMPKLCSEFVCSNCSKKYKDNSGLWRHKKKCLEKDIEIETNELNEQNDTVEFLKYLMKENSEFKQMIIEQNKQMIEMSKNNSITNNINYNNK